MSSKINPVPELTPKHIELFWSKVDRKGPDECWPWTGAIYDPKNGKSRYGIVIINGIRVYTHRVSYTLLVGPIPTDLTLDHVAAKCTLRGICCNPAHTEPVTRGENSKRHYLAQTHCKKGHPIVQHGRSCLQCNTQRKRDERAAKRQRDALKETA